MGELLGLHPAFENLADIGRGLLMVLGGFVAGMIFMTAVLYLIGKYYKKQVPRGIKKVLTYAFGFLIAVLVAMAVFTDMLGPGRGPGEGGGEVAGGRPDTPDRPDDTEPAEPKSPVGPPDRPPLSAGEAKPKQIARVQILGGFDERKRYYRFAGEARRLNLGQLTAELNRRRDEADRPLELKIYIYKNSASAQNRIVTKLRDWAEENRLDVSFPAVQDQRLPE